MRVDFFFAAGGVIFLAASPALPSETNFSVGEKALRISAEWNDQLDLSRYQGWLDEMARALASRLADAESANRVEVMNRFLFQEQSFGARPELEDSDSLFLDRIIDKKSGYCVGLASLYLSLGERIGMPLHAVAAPGHVFVRYEEGSIRRNIELTEMGRELSDAEYILKFRIQEESIRRGVFLRNLSPREFLGQILNNRAVLSHQRGDDEGALADYRRALRLDPRLQGVYYNRGNHWLLRGQFRKASRDLRRAVWLNPNDAQAWNNLGICHLELGRQGKALRSFEKAVSIYPGFLDAAENLRNLQEEIE